MHRFRQPPRQPTVVVAVAVLATWQQTKQRQQQQHDNNTTTNMTTNKIANMEWESLSGGNETMCETIVFFSVQVCLNPSTVLRQPDFQRYLFWGRKGMFLCFYVKKVCLWTLEHSQKHKNIKTYDIQHSIC